MTLKFNEETILYHIASGALLLNEALKKIHRDDFSPNYRDLFDALVEVQRKDGKITPESFIAELRKEESIMRFGGEQSVRELIGYAISADFEAEVLQLKEKAAANRIAQLASSDDPHEAIRLIRAELAKIPESAPKKLQLRWLSERDVNYLEVDAPPKPTLMFWMENSQTRTTFLHKEILAMLVGAGGVGKTHILAHLTICVATGIPFLGKFEFDAPGHVCFVVGENNEGDLHRLLRKTRVAVEDLLYDNQRRREHEQFRLLSDDPFLNVASRIMIFPVQGMDARFSQEDGQPTEFFKKFKADLKEKEPESGWHLIILDPLSRFSGVETEGDNGLATSFIALLEDLTLSLKGRPTILLSHHKPKGAVASSQSDQTAARGSSALTDGARWQANLDRDEEDPNVMSILGLVKSNFTSFPPRIRIKKSKNGCPKFDDFEPKKASKKGTK